MMFTIFLINLSSTFPVDDKIEIEDVESEPIFVQNVTENQGINEGWKINCKNIFNNFRNLIKIFLFEVLMFLNLIGAIKTTSEAKIISS